MTPRVKNPFKTAPDGIKAMMALEASIKASGLEHGLLEPAVFIQAMWIDGLPGFASLERNGVLQTTALAIENGRITGIYITRNPDKLSHVARTLAAHGAATLLH